MLIAVLQRVELSYVLKNLTKLKNRNDFCLQRDKEGILFFDRQQTARAERTGAFKQEK